jgi:hypothetical protein
LGGFFCRQKEWIGVSFAEKMADEIPFTDFGMGYAVSIISSCLAAS